MGTNAAQSPDPPSPQQTPHTEERANQHNPPIVESTLSTQSIAPQQDKTNLASTDAFAAEKARVQSLISRIVSNAHASAASTQTSHDSPSQRNSSRTQSPFEWNETATAASLVYRVPIDTRTINVSVKFAPEQLTLSVSPHDPQLVFKLHRNLRGRISVDSCWWALEDRSDGSRVLLVELEKTVPSMWGGVFEGDDQGVVEHPNAPSSAISNDTADATGSSETKSTGCDEEGPTLDHSVSNSQSVKEAVESFVDSVIDTVSSALTSQGNYGSSNADDHHQETEVEDISDDDGSPLATGSLGHHEIASAGATTDATSSQSSVSFSPSDSQGRKALIRADLPKLIAQHRAAVTAQGPGWSEAAVQLGTLYHYGIGVERDDAEAARLYRLGLDNGASDASAAFQLGLIYNQGDGANLRPDAEQAVKWWTAAAQLGNAVAMFNLGVLCMNGSGCDMDPVAAMRWFQQARELNPRLEVPQLTPAQLEQRVSMARRVRKERRWAEMSEEERERRRVEAFSKLKLALTVTAGVTALAVGMVFVQNWWRTRL